MVQILSQKMEMIVGQIVMPKLNQLEDRLKIVEGKLDELNEMKKCDALKILSY
jgi:hypothetical protein